MTAEADDSFMRRALALARRGLGLASPNPMVGAVLVKDGDVIGEGWHEGPGTPHAEAMALARAGDRARNATLYITLEPCSHFGRTGPCAPAVREAGVTRVVAAMRDPYPLVDGRGFELLREGGVSVEEGLLASQAERLVEGFVHVVRTGLPLVVLKMASSLDGKVAARDGSSRWITGGTARQDAHRLRAGSDAVVVGAGTAVTDDPSLTVRLEGYRGRQPLRVVVDGRGRLEPRGHLFDGAAPTLVATTPGAPEDRREAWEKAGAEVATFEQAEDRPECRVPLGELVEFLAKRDAQTVLIEGGPTLAWEAVSLGVVDRFVLYLSPKLVGGSDAPPVLGGEGVDTIGSAIGAEIIAVERMGDDLKVVADVHGHH